MANTTGGAAPELRTPKFRNAAVWAAAERHPIYEINQIHALDVDIDASRHGLNWSGGSAHRFQARAATRHDELHQHNDTLRYLLSLVRVAATMKTAAPGTGGTA